MALAPLQRAFGLEAVTAVTLQAVSGAGYPGVPSLDILGNVIPTIGGGSEEEKIAQEPQKILEAEFTVSVAVHRVPVVDGHTAAVFVKLENDAGLDEIRAALVGFTGEPQRLGLPTAPERPLVVHDRADRPQPLRDVNLGRGMSVSVGNLRPDPHYHARLTCLVHNTIRGAAGAALLNAELLVARGLVDGARPLAATAAAPAPAPAAAAPALVE
jgi:aspartate-semialdehyde dehydrogenase